MAQVPDTAQVDGRKANRWLSTIIVVIASVVAAGLLFGFSLAHLFTGRGMPVDDTGAERRVVVSAEFLELYLDDYILRLDAERFRKTQFVNNRIDLRYDYVQDDAELHTRIFFEDKVEDAEVKYQQQQGNIRGMIKAHGSTAKPDVVNSMLTWGDESAFTVVTDAGELAGAYFIARKDERVFVFWMEGIDFRNTDVIAQQIQQSLSALETYDPS